MKTTLAKSSEVKREWLHVDAKGQVLGRLAVKIADLLRGRGKVIYTPHVDTGDFVVVTNVEKIALTGNKEEDKQYMSYSGYFGNEKYRNVAHYRAKRPDFILWHAVKGMLPRNRLGRKMLTKLKLFSGDAHDHSAQQPKTLSLK